MAYSINDLQSAGQGVIDSFTGGADRNKAAGAYKGQGAMAGQQYDETKALNDKLTKIQKDRVTSGNQLQETYRNSVKNSFDPYKQQTLANQKEISADMLGQQKEYKQLDQNMGALQQRANADQNAGLSITEAMNPNNRIAQGQQALYSGQGKQYQDFARKQLQMPGNQVPQGMNPALFNSVNASNAGQAYAATQRRMDDMRNQGYMQGIVESQKSSQRGMDANARSRSLTGQRGVMLNRNVKSQTALGQENLDNAKMRKDASLDIRERLNNPSMLNMQKQFSTDQAGRNIAAINQRTGGVTGSYLGQAQMYGQSNGMLPAIAAGAGAYAGAQSKAPTPQQAPQGQPAQVNPGYAGYAQPSYLQAYQNQNSYGGPR